ncbi:hypothetical protein [Bacillus pinisoli]|uniref:hypothetical protein n=1 Tax=Bacillus pinisoli TaxID=2901866 RepID=UPI001FF44EAD|nr:hypothetical protein [Bacillus pinisoli]
MLKKFISVSLVLLFLLSSLSFVNSASAASTYDGKTLDTGIYWYGKGNVSEKFVSGQSNPYFDPSKPTFIYVHGWQPGTTSSLFRENFNGKNNDSTYGLNINFGDAWVDAGWNIGIFYWNQLSDESFVASAENKIWSASTSVGMRWKDIYGFYRTDNMPTVSAGELFYASFTEALSGYQGSNIRIAGHSLGNQMAVRLVKLVSDQVDAGNLQSNLLPNRVALLDPYWTSGSKSYLNGSSTGATVNSYVKELKAKGVVFEQYKSSTLSDTWGADSNPELETLTAFSILRPDYIPSTNQTARHNMIKNWYFHSYAFNPPTELTMGKNGRISTTPNVTASAKTTNIRIGEMQGNTYEWDQYDGKNTATVEDDTFLKITK